MERSARDGPQRAVALRYRPPGPDGPPAAAPQVVARGRGAVAERILELAREHGVAVREDRDLVELLSACSIGDEVPVEVWSAVAEVLAWVYGLGCGGQEGARDPGRALDSGP